MVAEWLTGMSMDRQFSEHGTSDLSLNWQCPSDDINIELLVDYSGLQTRQSNYILYFWREILPRRKLSLKLINYYDLMVLARRYYCIKDYSDCCQIHLTVM